MNKNKFLLGVALGSMCPLVAHIFTTKTDVASYFQGKTLSLYIIAALFNLFYIRYCYRKQLDQTAMGAVLSTFIALVYLLITQNIKL